MDKVNRLAEAIQSQIKAESSNKNLRPFFKYLGQKFDFGQTLVPLFPPHKIYVEPFMGAASIFIYKPKAEINVLNDINGDLVNLFIVVRDHYKELINMVFLTPFSEEYHAKVLNAFNSEQAWNSIKPIKRAFGYLYILQTSFQDHVGNIKYKPSFRYSNSKQNWSPNGICRRIYQLSVKLQNVIISYRSYKNLIAEPSLNNNNSFWYMDPPYTMSQKENYYSENFGPSNHKELSKQVQLLKCDWMMSYDNSEFIKELYKDYHITSLKQFGFENEIIITNYNIKEYIKQRDLFQ